MSIKKKLPGLLLLPLLLLAVFAYVKMDKKTNPPEIQGVFLPKAQFVMPFALTATDGTPFTDEDLLGHWSLMFFGFTYCPDICPTTLATVDTALSLLKEKSPNIIEPQVVFISVDPARDNLTQLSQYLKHFNPQFRGATGSDNQLKQLTKQMGIVYDQVFLKPNDADSYVMEHSTSLILVNPKGGIQAVFTSPHQPERLSDEILAVYQAYR